MKSLTGKYISILGASTSTFDGISNNGAVNSTIVNNKPYYPKDFMTDVADTWWMRTIGALDLKLCVNNSWSGTCVTSKRFGPESAACMGRAMQLHNDQLNIEPDIIILIIGGNDSLRDYEVGPYNGAGDVFDTSSNTYIGDDMLFGQAYAMMVHKVVSRYPNADVYVCSMLHWPPRKSTKDLCKYNDVIRQIADEFKITYVDLYNGTKIAPETAAEYFHTDGVHPNKDGFAQMADRIINTIKENYKATAD